MEKKQLREDIYMPKFCAAFKKLYVGEKDHIVKKCVRDVWRQFSKSSGQVNKKVWKLPKQFAQTEFSEELCAQLKRKWKDEYRMRANVKLMGFDRCFSMLISNPRFIVCLFRKVQ